VKTAIVLKAIYRANAISMKIPMSFLTEMTTLRSLLKFTWKHKTSQIVKAIVSKTRAMLRGITI
jgi:hypothetical protein